MMFLSCHCDELLYNQQASAISVQTCFVYSFVVRDSTKLLLEHMFLKNSTEKAQTYHENMFANYTFNSLRPIDAYMRRQHRPSLVQIMFCRLFGAKPLSEPMLTFWQLDPWEETSVKFQSKFKYFHSRKGMWKYFLPHSAHFVSASMCQYLTHVSQGSMS